MEGLSYNTRLSNCTKAERIISMFSSVSEVQFYEYFILSFLCAAKMSEHIPLEPSPTRSELYNYIGYLTDKLVHGKLYNFPGGRPSNYKSRASQPNHVLLDLPAQIKGTFSHFRKSQHCTTRLFILTISRAQPKAMPISVAIFIIMVVKSGCTKQIH